MQQRHCHTNNNCITLPITCYFCIKYPDMNTLGKLSVIAAVAVTGFSACKNGSGDGSKSTADSTRSTPRMPVAIAKVPASPAFPDAKLTISSATTEKVGKDSTKVTFSFDVKGYDLKGQTADAAGKGCNNSDKGQHIHFILDNAPYKALYEPKNEVTLPNDGKEHYLMCFLSRSYHESVKTPGAAVVYHFKVDEKGNMKKLDDPKTAMLFYSRPKGDYIGKDTANVLLDFYVWNGVLAADGYQVKAEIANEDLKTDTTITISAWDANFIQNLGTGKSKVTLTLLDKSGKNAEGPMTTASREFNLFAAEPMKK